MSGNGKLVLTSFQEFVDVFGLSKPDDTAQVVFQCSTEGCEGQPSIEEVQFFKWNPICPSCAQALKALADKEGAIIQVHDFLDCLDVKQRLAEKKKEKKETVIHLLDALRDPRGENEDTRKKALSAKMLISLQMSKLRFLAAGRLPRTEDLVRAEKNYKLFDEALEEYIECVREGKSRGEAGDPEFADGQAWPIQSLASWDKYSDAMAYLVGISPDQINRLSKPYPPRDPGVFAVRVWDSRERQEKFLLMDKEHATIAGEVLYERYIEHCKTTGKRPVVDKNKYLDRQVRALALAQKIASKILEERRVISDRREKGSKISLADIAKSKKVDKDKLSKQERKKLAKAQARAHG